MKLSTLATISFFLLSTATWAQTEDPTLFGQIEDEFGPKPGAVTFTLLGGAYFHGRDQFLFDTDDKLSEIWNMGLRLGYGLTENVEIEASFGFTPTQTLRAEQHVFSYFLDGLAQWPLHPQVVPYATLGFGRVTYDMDSLSITSSHWGVDYGVGFKFFPFKSLAIRPDFRAMTTFQDTQTSFLATLNLTYYGLWKRPPPKDHDGDGIPDYADLCPTGPETFNAFEDSDGCPDVLPDTDKDGIPDNVDNCPDQPETVNGFEDHDGCPDEISDQDRDQDGIPDAKDQCPDEAETKNGFRDDDGCPDAEIERFNGEFKGIYFASGKAEVLEESAPALEEAVSILKKYPELNVRIEGHTDSTGSESFNLKLSEDRAKSIQKALVDRGIDADRLLTHGFGETKPVGDNQTSEGRKQNRRIEIWIQEQDTEKP